MFERFTERARRVLVLAQGSAQDMHQNFIGTEHLLVGLVEEGTGVAAVVLQSFGLTPEPVRARLLPPSDTLSPIGQTGRPPFTPRAKRVLELALREALNLGHNYIGTEHILLGLISEGEGVGALALPDLGAPLPEVRARVLQALSGFLRPGGTQQHLSRPARRALDRARAQSADKPLTTGHLLDALLTEDPSQASLALRSLGVTRETLAAAMATFPEDVPEPVDVKVDPEVAAALAQLDPKDVKLALRRLVEGKSEPDSA